MSVNQIYEEAVKPLPPRERLQLATLILNDIPPQAVVDYSTEWSDEDLADWTKAGWCSLEARLGEEPDA